MHEPFRDIQIIGDEVAIAWDGAVNRISTSEQLRPASPSAANIGERDILGVTAATEGTDRKKFPGVQVFGELRAAFRFQRWPPHRPLRFRLFAPAC